MALGAQVMVLAQEEGAELQHTAQKATAAPQLELEIDPQQLQRDPQLPQITTSFHLSSYRYPQLIKRFDQFLSEQAPMLSQLHQQFGVP